MKEMKFYGTALPDVEVEPYAGKLIVIEGTDGVGRSTHVAQLRIWLESIGYAVLDTGMTRSILAGRGIKNARRGHTLGRLTMQLYYATDFADRLENQMLAALRAGFIVLTDRTFTRPSLEQSCAVLIQGGSGRFMVLRSYPMRSFTFASSQPRNWPRASWRRAADLIIGNRAWTWDWETITTTVSSPIRNCYSRNSTA